MPASADAPAVQQVPPEVTRPLRQRLFKPNSTLEDLARADGNYPTAGYYAALDPNGDVLAIASARPEAPPWPCEAANPWRIRAIATVENQRHRGLGTSAMRAVLKHVRRHGGDLAWLNGRTPARTFYERLGLSSAATTGTTPRAELISR